MGMRQRSDSRILPLKKEDDENEGTSSSSYYAQSTTDDGSRTGVRAITMHQGRPFFFLLLTWVVFVLYLIHPRTGEMPVLFTPNNSTNATIKKPPASLHMVVPASKADSNLCKVLVSAGILGYPDPVIVNWNQSYDEGKYVEGGSHLAKISGINDYLQELKPEQDEDIVLMVDGYDIWLQLRPQTLIDRYFEVNARADARIAQDLGPAAEKHNIHQEIIFGCQKRCWPWTKNDPPCYAVPYSSLPKDVYGPETDTDIGYEPNPYIKYRPRCINSGVVVGTVRAMRKMFEQAMVLLPHESNMGSDQYIFSHILGDQEIWREALRRDELTEAQKAAEAKKEPLHPWNETHIEEVRAKAQSRADQNFEFGIGLDYRMEIGINTVFSEDDTAWLTWNNKTILKQAEEKVGVPQNKKHSHMYVDGLAQDINSTVPPYWTFNIEPELNRSKGWEDVPLFTNVWTGIVPAVVHHNAHRDGRKSLRKTWWNETWYFPHMRTMYDAHIYEPIIPLAYSGPSQEELREYWPVERWKGGGRSGPRLNKYGYKDPAASWLRFDRICKEHHNEVFRDGLGPWDLPPIH